MAKREKKEKKLKENGEESDNRLATVIFTLLTILIWLAVFAVLIKLDVGGFGSKVLRPLLKEVPGVNLILPGATDEEIIEENNQTFTNLAEAAAYIQELEARLAQYEASGSANEEAIGELNSEIERLRAFEEAQKAFQQEKEQYYQEVVLGNGTEVMQSFQQWYENMDPATAEVIYRQVLEQLQLDEQTKEYASIYSRMEPADVALIFQEMTGDLDTVAMILKNMEVKKRGDILSAIAQNDATFAAKLTQLLAP